MHQRSSRQIRYSRAQAQRRGLARLALAPRQSLVRAVCTAMALLLSGPMAAAGPITRDDLKLEFELTPERLTRNFDIVVFHNEFNERVDHYLRKWVDPIRIYLDVRSGERDVVEYLTHRHVQRLRHITGHNITFVDERTEANLTVVFEREARLDEVGSDYFETYFNLDTAMRENVCFGRYYSNTGHQIFNAVIVIPTDRAMSRGRLPACIIEEITQVLGLPNDSEEVFPSIFNDKSIDEDLSWQDVILIRLLYNERLKPGMPRQEVLREVRRMLDEMYPSGRIGG